MKKDEFIVTPVIYIYMGDSSKKLWVSNYGNLYEYCSEAYMPNGYEVNGFELCDSWVAFNNDIPLSEKMLKKMEAYFQNSTVVHSVPDISCVYHMIETLKLEDKVDRLNKIIEKQQSQINQLILHIPKQ